MIEGQVWKYGDDINTDVIFPGKYTYTITDPKEMAIHALEDLDPEFAKNVKKGDIIIAGENFGCGSSREQAPISIKEAGAGAIVAKSFARIFFRNAINAGLLVVSCKEVIDSVKNGDRIKLDPKAGLIFANGKKYSYPPFSKEVSEILECGGLVEYTKKKIANG